MIFNILFSVFIILFCVYKYITYNYGYWDGKNVPLRDISPSIFLWRMWLGRSAGKLYQDTYRKFRKEKYVAGFAGRSPELIICDPDLIKCVLIKDFSNFIERTRDVTDEVEVLNGHLLNADRIKWRPMRQKFTPAFTSGKLRSMFPLVVEKAEDFQRFLHKQVEKSKEMEIRDLMARFTTDVIGSVAFGIKIGAIESENSPIRQIGKRFFTSNPWKHFKRILRIISPELFVALKLRLQSVEDEQFFINIIGNIVNERELKGITRNDFIQLLLELRNHEFIKVDIKEGEERINISEEFIAAQAFSFFVAGFETSSAVMTFTMFELARHPRVQEKLTEEIDKVLEKHDGKLSYDSIAEMEYLECSVNETMRKYPALGHLTRVCTSKYTFPDTDLTIGDGVLISVPTLALHYDPKYYPDPHKYMPERFLPEAKKERHPMVYLPFGEGPRNCIGLRFGKMQSMIGIASLLSKFTVHTSSKTEDKIIINARTFVTTTKHGVWLTMKPRKL